MRREAGIRESPAMPGRPGRFAFDIMDAGRDDLDEQGLGPPGLH